MKICFVHEEYPEETNFGGIATYQKIMAEELATMGHTVYVICRGLTCSRSYQKNKVNIIRVFVQKKKNEKEEYIEYRKKVSLILEKLQKKGKIEIIETPDWGANTIFFEEKRKVPLVVRLHTPLKIWLQYNKNNFGEVCNKMLEWEEKMLRNADTITCCSNILQKMISSEFYIPKKEIKVIPNPANITQFYRDPSIQKEDILLFIGSLEERKGVLVFAQALNKIFKKYPKLKVQFIGKDTTRNQKNISTKKYILEQIEEKYHPNLQFLGQLENKELNKYLNQAKVAAFPSLFDNFPYVVLEAMATGIHIVGSKNSGMVEMLEDDSSIYETKNASDLAFKLMNKYEYSKKVPINRGHIKRVKEMYDTQKIALEMLKIYQTTINHNRKKNIQKEELETVLKKVTRKNKIINYHKLNKNLANTIFHVSTQEKEYIIKKYQYPYNFKLENKLYTLYEKQNIAVIKPINKKTILYNQATYNIFEYQKSSSQKEISIEYLSSLLNCERKVKNDPTLQKKCDYYYNFLLHSKSLIKKEEEVKIVTKIYSTLREDPLLQERYLNHGDISKDNIIVTKERKYIIDFDEVTITSPLYDFAVVLIKLYTKNDQIDISKYEDLKKRFQKKYPQYQEEEYFKMIKIYLCKIVMEKFYYHAHQKIDLYSKKQKKDDYQKYFNLLKKINKEQEFSYE